MVKSKPFFLLLEGNPSHECCSSRENQVQLLSLCGVLGYLCWALVFCSFCHPDKLSCHPQVTWNSGLGGGHTDFIFPWFLFTLSGLHCKTVFFFLRPRAGKQELTYQTITTFWSLRVCDVNSSLFFRGFRNPLCKNMHLHNFQNTFLWSHCPSSLPVGHADTKDLQVWVPALPLCHLQTEGELEQAALEGGKSSVLMHLTFVELNYKGPRRAERLHWLQTQFPRGI